MKKVFVSITILFLLSACQLDEVVALIITPTVPPPTPSVTSTATVFQTPTRTPTATLIPTFTTTPTLAEGIHGSYTEAAEIDPKYLPTLYVVPTVTPAPKPMLAGLGPFFNSLTISKDILFWGYCDERKYVDFEVRTTNNRRVTYVLLFMRLVDKGGNQSTAWGGGAIMKRNSSGSYTYRVRPENIEHYEEFKDAWIEYQIVAATSTLKSLGRTQIYMEEISLKKCEATETDE